MFKHVLRHLKRVRPYAHQWVRILIEFPPGAFDAPHWSPGHDFYPTIENLAWYKRDPSDFGTVTAVVIVSPKLLPACDGGVWREPEVWTVEIEEWAEEGTRLFYQLWDKPHRVTQALNHRFARVLDRTPLAGHPAEPMVRYWDDFRNRWGFVPDDITTGRPKIILEWDAKWDPPYHVARVAAQVAKRWSAQLRIYARWEHLIDTCPEISLDPVHPYRYPGRRR